MEDQTDKSDKVIEKDDEYLGLKRSRITSFREMLETAAKVLVGVSVLSYILGLLITNMHLRKYGVFHLSFTQFEYVLTGLLWLFLVGFSYEVYAYLVIDTTLKPDMPRWVRAIFKLVILLAYFVSGTLILFFPLSFLSGYENDLFSWNTIYSSVSLLIAPMVINGFRKDAYRFFQAAKQRKLPISPPGTIIGILFILASVAGYAIGVYPELSPVYGGGKQQKLVLVVKPDQVTQLKSLGINVSLDSRQIGPLEVVYEAADYLILSTPEEIKERDHVQSIRLKKDLFDAILQVDSKYIKPMPTPNPISTPSPASSQSPSPSPTADSRKKSDQIEKGN